MAEIPNHERWMKDTYSLTRPRSEFLKKVDAAVATYDKNKSPVSREAIKTALDRWRFEQSKAGKDWHTSVRNQKGAVTNLYRAVNDLDRRNLSKEELEAMQYISRTQALALEEQFRGKELTFKASTLVGVATRAGTTWQRFKTGAGAVKKGKDEVAGAVKTGKEIKSGIDTLKQGGRAAAAASSGKDVADTFGTVKGSIAKLCKELCPGVDPDTVFKALQLGSVESFATSLVPFVGAISAGGKAVVGWIGVARTAWQKHSLAGTRYAFAPKDPEAAFDAVLVLLDREIVSKTAKATAGTAAFTGKLLGTFADGGAVSGPVIDLLEKLAELFQTIVEYVRDIREVRAANEVLRAGALDLGLFQVCPTLGCYFLVVQDHSTIIHFAVGDYGTPDFVFDVERLLEKIGPVLDKARSCIQASRFEIVGFQKSKGVVEQNWKTKGKLGKVTGLKDHVKDSLAQQLDGWFEKPQKPPKVDKSRIVGFGSSTRAGS